MHKGQNLNVYCPGIAMAAQFTGPLIGNNGNVMHALNDRTKTRVRFDNEGEIRMGHVSGTLRTHFRHQLPKFQKVRILRVSTDATSRCPFASRSIAWVSSNSYFLKCSYLFSFCLTGSMAQALHAMNYASIKLARTYGQGPMPNCDAYTGLFMDLKQSQRILLQHGGFHSLQNKYHFTFLNLTFVQYFNFSIVCFRFPDVKIGFSAHEGQSSLIRCDIQGKSLVKCTIAASHVMGLMFP